jgi:hypothetical protein
LDLDNSSDKITQFNKDFANEMGKAPFFCDANCSSDPANVRSVFL